MDLRVVQKIVYQNKVNKGFNITLATEIDHKVEINQEREYKMVDGVLKRVSDR